MMLEKIDRIIANWNKSKISPVGKAILINSSPLSIPLYYLFVYPISDVVLDKISTSARKFHWPNCGHESGIHLVNRIDITLDRSKGGLSIKDLKISKVALMAKHVFSFLNSRDLIWVDILIQKYGNFNIWTDSTLANY